MKIISRQPWLRWFRPVVARRARALMARQLLDEGPEADWRQVGDDLRRALGLEPIATKK